MNKLPDILETFASAKKKIAALASNPDFSREYKDKELANIKSPAIAEMTRLRTEALADIEQRRAAALQRTAIPAPTIEEGAVLMYQAMVLERRWKNQDVPGMMADFERVVASGDKAAIRVVLDLGGELLKGKLAETFNTSPEQLPVNPTFEAMSKKAKLAFGVDVNKVDREIAVLENEITEVRKTAYQVNELERLVLNRTGDGAETAPYETAARARL